MIGLGSNRLSVCRRGGMRVTQAGRGGMEWLAGGRVPSWASPYSAQATAALKAQFPTQWPTIRDYGFAHPEIVGYMNAYAPEDAKIAYSLVEGIGTRWLVKTGGAYINTGWKCPASSGLYVRFTFKLAIVNSDYKILGSSNGMRVGPYSNTIRAAFDAWGSRANITANTPFTIEQNSGSWKCGSTAWSSSKSSSSTQDTLIFGMNGEGVASNNQWCSEFIAIKNGEGRQMYPFIRKINGVDVCGMIDVLSGTFYQNAGSGSFTISETPAS